MMSSLGTSLRNVGQLAKTAASQALRSVGYAVEVRFNRLKLQATHTRNYASANSKRRDLMRMTTVSPNGAIAQDLVDLITRSQDLVRNNPWANKALNVIVSETIGTGISSEVKVKRGGKKAKALNARWQDWKESTNVDFAGELNLDGITQQALRTVVESGFCLAIKRIENRKLKIQLIEPLQLDLAKNEELRPNHRIVNGVELKNDRVVAYWIFTQPPGENHRGDPSQKFIAEDVALVKRVGRPGQRLDVPWVTPAMTSLVDLDDYEDAYLLRQKIANCITAFVYGTDIDSENQVSEIPEKLEAGSIVELSDNSDVKFSDPPKADSYGPYVNQVLYRVAATYGITYESLSGDLSGVNFSSGRMGWLQMHRNVETWRWMMIIPQLVEVVFKWWLEVEELHGRVTRAYHLECTPPAREIFNPPAETKALKDQCRAGFISIPEAQRKLGYDPETIVEENAEFIAMANSMDLKFDSIPAHDPRREQ